MHDSIALVFFNRYNNPAEGGDLEYMADKLNDTIKIRGFFRLKITEDGPNGKVLVVGDSGWLKNQVVNLGFNDYLVKSLGSMAGSKYLTHLAVGTGSQPGAADTSLEGEQSKRTTITAASSSGSKTLRLTGTFGSSDSFVTATKNLSNIGLFNTSSGGTLFAGNTFASSSCATNQNVNATYDITFS